MKKYGLIAKLALIISIVMLSIFVISSASTVGVYSLSKKQSTADYNYENVLKSQAKVEIDKTTITALEEVNTVHFSTTLITDNETYCKLYKNPKLIYEMPDNVTLSNVSGLTLLGETQLQIVSANIEDGKLVIELAGEQTAIKSTDMNAQIVFDADLVVDRFIANSSKNISLTVINANDTENREYFAQVNVNSYEGFIMYEKVEGNTIAGEEAVLEVYNDKENEGQLEMDQGAKTLTVSAKIINNYGYNVDNLKVTFKPKFVHANNQEDIIDTNITSFTNGELIIPTFAVGEVLEFTTQIQVPANLYFNEKLDLGITTSFVNQQNEITNSLVLDYKTPTKAGVGDISRIFNDNVRIECLAQYANEILTPNQDVKQGSKITYTFTVTNLGNDTIDSLNLKFTRLNNNTKIYDLKPYEVDIFGEQLYTKENLDESSITKAITNLEPKAIKTASFEITVGQYQANNNVIANTIEVINGQDTISLQTMNNTIVDSDIAVRMNNRVVISLTEDVIKVTGSYYTLDYNIFVENYTGAKITEDSTVKVYMPSYITNAEVSKVVGDDETETIEASLENGVLTFELKDISVDGEHLILNVRAENFPTEEETIACYTEIIKGTNNYKSNVLYRNFEFKDVDITCDAICNKTEETIIEKGNDLEYTINLTNNSISDNNIDIKGTLSNLQIKTITINGENYDKYIYIDEDLLSTMTEEEYAEYIKNLYTISFLLKAGQSAEVKIVATVVEEENTSNMFTVYAENLEQKYFSFVNKVDTSEFSDVEEQGEVQEYTLGDLDGEQVWYLEDGYSLSGKIWLDENKNGIKDDNEKGISNLRVRLLDTEKNNEYAINNKGAEASTVSDENGNYKLANLNAGKYFVLAEFDGKTYELTEFMKNGVDEKVASRFKDYKIESSNANYGITEVIELGPSTSDINMGLTNLTNFDMKLEKRISKVTVQNSQGTRVYEFDNKELVKVEIPGKRMEGSVVITEYELKITNEGELPGYINSVTDYLPEDMKFVSESNKDWVENEKGVLTNTSLTNVAIKPGESSTLDLVLVKTMTKDNVGSSVNNAEINEYTNVKERIDSNLENNKSQATLVVSVKTGEIILRFVLFAAVIGIIGFGIYEIKKRVLK